MADCTADKVDGDGGSADVIVEPEVVSLSNGDVTTAVDSPVVGTLVS